MKAILPDGSEVGPSYNASPYHGTATDPETVFTVGLKAKGSDRRLLDHVKGNPQSAFRGSTSTPTVSEEGRQGATEWAGDDGWVYQVDIMPCWDVEQLLEGRVPVPGGYGNSPHTGECESAIPGSIRPDQIIRAGKVSTRYGKLRVMSWQENNCQKK